MEDRELRAFLHGKIALSGTAIEITDERVTVHVPDLGTTQQTTLINLTHQEMGKLVGLLGRRGFYIRTKVPSIFTLVAEK